MFVRVAEAACKMPSAVGGMQGASDKILVIAMMKRSTLDTNAYKFTTSKVCNNTLEL
ncbi:hypothetical protein ACN4EG_11090 [Alkalinema pantanalense CENA528]|uniref:hypothetical protein n=1 Tax=Alkalinema pantanalense TaxID=1620705 RepID=UPI003D6F8F2E